MRLRSKILVGFGISLVLVVVVWAWAIVNLNHLGNASQAILQENYRSIIAAENMIDTIERQDSGALLLMLGHSQEGLAQFQQNEVEFLQWLGRAKDNITIPGEDKILATIESRYLQFLAKSTRLHELVMTEEDSALTYYQQSVLPEFKLVRDKCIELRNLNQNEMVRVSQRAQAISRRAIWSTMLIGALAAVVGLFFSLLLSNLLARPLQEMSQAADRIAEGDYDVTITARSQDEVGRLAQKIMAMSHRLKAFHDLNVSQLITEKRRSEAIIHSIADGLVVVNAEGEVIAVNPQAAQIMGVVAEEVQGRHCADVIVDRGLYEQVRATAESGEPPELSEEQSTLAVRRGGQTQYYHASITPVKTAQGTTLGVVLLLQDVTKLKELDRLKSDFVMTASHELRTPLTSIAMSIGLLRENTWSRLSEREQQLLDAAEEETQRLRSLVNELLELSKIETGRIEMAFEEVRADLLMEKAASVFLDQTRDREVELTWQARPDLPDVWADPNKITWVLTNLIANALRYTDPGGHIRLAARRMGGFAYLSVADDGTGIPLEYQSKIFDKFVQVKDGRSAGGTGLGLSICREIVKAHGGTIWVDSAPGRGSTFTFTLPIVVDTAATGDAADVGHGAEASATTGTQTDGTGANDEHARSADLESPDRGRREEHQVDHVTGAGGAGT